MRFILPPAFTTSILLMLGAAESGGAESANDPLLELPAPVKTTIQREASGRNVAAIARDQREGRTVYHVRIAQDGIDKRLVITSDGALIEVSDYPAVNNAIADGKQASKEAWDKTKEVSGEAWDATKGAASRTWEATKDSVRKAASAFNSEELTLNQVPRVPRDTMEREAAGDRLTAIRATIADQNTLYHATINHPDGTARALVVREDGTLVTAP
ncbi:MAG: hypothetical protein H0W78_13635 [Planctomycetes bacterium]|jgi:hypothetical protein|nr:hypothetical protein [Planctomycetota bacterium]